MQQHKNPGATLVLTFRTVEVESYATLDQEAMGGVMCKSGVETDRRSNDDRETKRVMVAPSLTTGMRFKRWTEQDEELLPGMLDDITLKHISTKLSWRDIHVLSTVSPGWQQALQSGKIYKSRVDPYSTETLAVIRGIHFPGKDGFQVKASFYLYSFREKYFCELPPFPFGTGWILATKFLSLDRRIYVLGGIIRQHTGKTWDAKLGEPNSNVYMLDIGEKQWKQCASMSEPKRDLVFAAAAALNGKIYVFGGLGHRVANGANFRCPLSACEVYDPKIDAWSLIKPMPSSQWDHKVVTIGDELFVYDGRSFCSGSISGAREFVTFLDIYHPIKDEWRRILPSELRRWDTVFTVRGNFHMMDSYRIEVYDIEKDLWSLLHTFHNAPGWPYRAIALGDELVITAGNWRMCSGESKASLFQSKGFGSKNRAITWEKVDDSLPYFHNWIPIQL